MQQEVMRKKFLNTIKTNVERLENIVLDFLNISKIENSNLVNISQVAVEKIKKESQTEEDEVIRPSSN